MTACLKPDGSFRRLERESQKLSNAANPPQSESKGYAKLQSDRSF